MKRALVLSLCVMLGLLMGSVMTAWAGPTFGLNYLNYDNGVDSEQLLPAFGFSYVHEFGGSFGVFGDYKLTDLEFHVGDPWVFATEGYLDLQGTYDLTLYAVEDTPIFVLRPGVGFIFPLEFAVVPDFHFGIYDPGVVGSVALVCPYLTLRVEVIYSALGFGWGLGATIDWFDWEPLFRSRDSDVSDAP